MTKIALNLMASNLIEIVDLIEEVQELLDYLRNQFDKSNINYHKAFEIVDDLASSTSYLMDYIAEAKNEEED